MVAISLKPTLKTRDGILRAKTECFEYMKDSSKIILNGDDDKLSGIKSVPGKELHFFSFSNASCDAYASVVQNRQLYGSDAVIHLKNGEAEESFPVHISLPGDHMVMNAVAAALLGHLLGLDDEQIAEGIAGVEAMDGRGKMIRTERYTLIDSCYNANPKAVKAELDLLACANTRKVALLGDMLELGNNEKDLHYEVGNYACKKGIDVLICVGTLSEYTAKGAQESDDKDGTEVYYFTDKPAFMKTADAILREDDTVLIKASNGSGFRELLDYLSASKSF